MNIGRYDDGILEFAASVFYERAAHFEDRFRWQAMHDVRRVQAPQKKRLRKKCQVCGNPCVSKYCIECVVGVTRKRERDRQWEIKSKNQKR